jgi:hypothetical protein
MYESDRGSDRASTHAPISWIARHPIVFWGGLWTIALSITVGVTVGLLHGRLFVPQDSLDLSLSSRQDSQTRGDEGEFEAWRDPQVESEARSLQDTPSPSPKPKMFLPLWLIGAIALSCSVGSFFVTLILKSFSSSQNASERLQPASASQELTYNSMPRFQTQFGATPYQTPIIAETQPRVTVLPPEATTPLDFPERDGNLLEQLDLRKRHSLSSLMEYTEEESFQ